MAPETFLMVPPKCVNFVACNLKHDAAYELVYIHTHNPCLSFLPSSRPADSFFNFSGGEEVQEKFFKAGSKNLVEGGNSKMRAREAREFFALPPLNDTLYPSIYSSLIFIRFGSFSTKEPFAFLFRMEDRKS